MDQFEYLGSTFACIPSQMSADDVKVLSASRHVDTLRILRLDYNDFKECVDDVVDLLSRLRSIQILRMQACRIKSRNCMRCAEALAHSQTLRVWKFTDNALFKVSSLRVVVSRLSLLSKHSELYWRRMILGCTKCRTISLQFAVF